VLSASEQIRHVEELLGRSGGIFRETTFPHHKHVGPDETPEETPQPTLHQLVEETLLAVRGRYVAPRT